MDRLVFGSWLALAAIHAAPAAVVFYPTLSASLYGVPPTGPTGILIIHRGVLFLAVLVVAIYAAFRPEARRAASLLAGISVVGYLIVYIGAGAPSGPLRTVALVDILALVPLGHVTRKAWLSST